MTAEAKVSHAHFFSKLSRLWPWVAEEKRSLGVGMALVYASTAVEVALPWIMGEIVDAVQAKELEHRWSILCISFFVLIAGRGILEYFQGLFIQKAGQRISHRLRSAIFERILQCEVSFFDRNRVGRLLTRVINDVKSVAEVLSASMSILILDVFIILGTLAFMAWIQPQLTVLTLFSFPFLVYLIPRFGKKMAFSYRQVRERLSEINAFLGENIPALPVVQKLVASRSQEEKFKAVCRSHRQAQLESVQAFAVIQPISNLFNGFATASLIWFGGLWVLEGKITLGVFVAFLGYLRNLFQPIRDLVEKYNVFLSSAVAAERIVTSLDLESEYQADREGTFITPAGIALELSEVTFTYPERRDPALVGISLTVRENEVVGIVGATGSGKTTLTKLLMRFYEPDTGIITLGGLSLRDWPKAKLRESIAVVHQDIFLFGGTLRDNLCLGKAGADDAFLIECCRRSGLWPRVERAGGLDLLIAEGGSNLSQGEKQLVSLARALVLQAPILIFDEATSSIDPLLERRLIDTVFEESKGRVVLMIAHRLDTLERCRRIVEFREGRLIWEGSWRELLDRRSVPA